MGSRSPSPRRSRSPMDYSRSPERRSASRSPPPASRSPRDERSYSGSPARRDNSRDRSYTGGNSYSIDRSMSSFEILSAGGRAALESTADSKGRDRDDWGVEYLDISDSDAAFILGKGGRTKEKIARVSEARIEMNERNGQSTLEVRGTALQRRKTMKYVRHVMAQRVGPVHVDDNDQDDDLTMIEVPSECVGFVTGKQGNFLRTMEDEWGVIMFFAEFKGARDRAPGSVEKLAVFGPRRGRRGAELKVMSAIEQKNRGYLTRSMRDHISDEEWGTDTRWLKDDELSYALGKRGMTRRKLAKASNCIVEYIGNVVHMAGNKRQRTRAAQYLQWLFEQLAGPVHVDVDKRSDVTVVDVPSACVGYVTGNRRETLGRMEEEWGVLMFFLDSYKDDPERHKRTMEKLAIFGGKRARRGAELKVMSAVEAKEPGWFTKGMREEEARSNWGSDTLLFTDTELAYALGRDGTTRRKLARAAGCIIEYVGKVAFLCGVREERQRARRYLGWLLKQRSGQVRIENASAMNDVVVVNVPKDCIGAVSGSRGQALRQIEEETGTFCIIAFDAHDEEQLFVFSWSEQSRSKAQTLVGQIIRDTINNRSRGGGYDRDGYGDRGRDRDRGYSPDRRGDYDRGGYDRGGRRGSPDYGDRRGGGGRRSPDYGRGRSPDYGRGRSPPRRGYSPDYDRRGRSPPRRGYSPDYDRRGGGGGGRYRSRSPRGYR